MNEHWIVAWSVGFLGGLWLAGLAIGGAFVLALGAVSGARWMEQVRPSIERLARLGLTGGPIVLVMIACSGALVPLAGVRAGARAGEWMSTAAVLARGLLYVAAWTLCVLLVTSRRRGRTGPAAATLIVMPAVAWLAVADWIAPLVPGWFSTAYGLQFLAGATLGVVALATIVQSSTERAHTTGSTATGAGIDLATLLLSVACLWAYLWFCQHLLDWYDHDAAGAPLRERRVGAAWRVLYFGVPLLAWLAPFVLLLSARAKRLPRVRLAAAASATLGVALDPASLLLPALGEPRRTHVAAIAALLVLAITVIARHGDQSRRVA